MQSLWLVDEQQFDEARALLDDIENQTRESNLSIKAKRTRQDQNVLESFRAEPVRFACILAF